MSFICYFVNTSLWLLFFFTYHIFCIYIPCYLGRVSFFWGGGRGLGSSAIFSFLYICNGICSMKILLPFSRCHYLIRVISVRNSGRVEQLYIYCLGC